MNTRKYPSSFFLPSVGGLPATDPHKAGSLPSLLGAQARRRKKKRGFHPTVMALYQLFLWLQDVRSEVIIP